MRWEDISDAFNLLDDDIIKEAANVRMYNKSAKNMPIRTHRRSLRMSRTLIIAAFVAALLAVCGFAVYVYWHMPDKGETYTGDTIQTHEVNSYPVPGQTEKNAPDSWETPAIDHSKFSDEWFIEQAVYVLNTVNKQDTDASHLTVTHQTNQQWNREEVLVSFSDAANKTSEAVFDAERGCLIRVTAFDKEITGNTPMSESDALATAQHFYDTLPYAEGYVFDYVEKYDDHAWSFHFDKPIQIQLWGAIQTIYSDYEQVRIVIDPCSGTFQLSNCFYVPLLDDHAPQSKPITQEDAMAVVKAAQIISGEIEHYKLDAKIGVCLPRPGELSLHNGTAAYNGENYKYYGITRLGWIMTFQSEPDQYGFTSCYQICIDLYTGELLSFDMAK